MTDNHTIFEDAFHDSLWFLLELHLHVLDLKPPYRSLNPSPISYTLPPSRVCVIFYFYTANVNIRDARHPPEARRAG